MVVLVHWADFESDSHAIAENQNQQTCLLTDQRDYDDGGIRRIIYAR